MKGPCVSDAWLVLFVIVVVHSAATATKSQRIILDKHVFKDTYAAYALHDISQVKEQKGIVFPCGGTKQLANAYVGARVIRNYLHCNLPIEIAYYGAHEMDTYHESLFKGISNTKLTDLSAVKHLEYKADFVVTSFAIKAFAIIHSSFAEVLCLDCDNIPLYNPSTLFTAPQYQQHGNIFWSDPNINSLDPLVYQMFGLPVPWEGREDFLASESGQILINSQQNQSVQPNQSGPQLGLTPWKRPEGLFYVSAGFVQPDFANSTAFYHRVEHGAKFNPASPLILNPLFVTTTLSPSWRRPAGVTWFDLEYGGGGLATHYPVSGVNTSAHQQCCTSSASDASYSSSCSCQSTSSYNGNMMLAVPISYFPELRRVISISEKIFSAYQHDLWRHEALSQS
ncbi:MAG: hypothetical protein FRX49_01483 [Trebouxia sp. A1-2]|nr:MAG: hypothetical protein FRX49_01483 [Trebouxia sp. A1-2]